MFELRKENHTMSMKLLVKLQSNLIRHGQSAVKRNTSKAAIAKLRAMTKSKETESVETSTKEKVRGPINEIKENYFTNSSSTRAKIIYEGDYGDNSFVILDEQYNALLKLATFDYNEAKLRYKETKNALNEEMASRFSGIVLPDNLAKEYQERLHKASFLCWKHQLTFIIYSDEEFEGGTYDERRKIWVAATTSVAIYTENILTKDQVESIEIGSKDTVISPLLGSRVVTRIKEVINGVVRFRPLNFDEDIDDFLDVI